MCGKKLRGLDRKIRDEEVVPMGRNKEKRGETSEERDTNERKKREKGLKGIVLCVESDSIYSYFTERTQFLIFPYNSKLSNFYFPSPKGAKWPAHLTPKNSVLE